MSSNTNLSPGELPIMETVPEKESERSAEKLHDSKDKCCDGKYCEEVTEKLAKLQTGLATIFPSQSRSPDAEKADESKLSDKLRIPRPTITKTKSLTAAEVKQEMMAATDIAKVAEQLREEPPLSLEEVRLRRASIKEERKKSIDFIRSRTNSRAAALGRPALGALEENLPDSK